QAARYAITLDEDIHRDESIIPISSGHALVYQGTSRSTGTKVAIKIVQGAPAHAVKSALREVHIWSKLRHENVVPLLGITTNLDGTISLVTEWMPHGNAHNYVQDPFIDPRPLLLDIARGLCYLHNYVRPIFHGDVKGANVLISDRGRALLTDFGLAFLTSSSFSMSTPHGSSLPWLAPENLDSHECAITRPGDIWAFGMTALVWLAIVVTYRTR
ncbi:hypothetical protein ID866_12834, partial [Astraeus odoratus]